MILRWGRFWLCFALCAGLTLLLTLTGLAP